MSSEKDFAATLRLEGGPPPQSLVAGPAELVALMTGYFAHCSTLPEPSAHSRARDLQRRQLEVCLPWCADLLGLPKPL